MNRIVFILTFLIVSFQTNAQRIITMEPYNGVYRIPCTVNGAKMKMVFDTGASSVTMSLSMAQYLYDNDFISKEDFKNVGQTLMADGRVVDHLKLNLKDLAIASMHIENVEAVVLSSQDAPLLLGQSALSKIGKYSIDGNNLIIYDGKDEYTEEEIAKLWDVGKKASDEGNFAKAEECLKEIYYVDMLTNYGKYEYAFACLQNKDYNQAIKVLKELENTDFASAKAYDFASIQVNIFSLMADCYLYLSNTDLAVFYIKKGVSIIPVQMKLASGKIVSTIRTLKPTLYYNFALLCNELKYYDLSSEYFWEAIRLYSKSYSISEDKCWNFFVNGNLNHKSKILEDEEFQRSATNYAYNKWLSNDWSDDYYDKVIDNLISNGNRFARDYK